MCQASSLAYRTWSSLTRMRALSDRRSERALIRVKLDQVRYARLLAWHIWVQIVHQPAPEAAHTMCPMLMANAPQSTLRAALPRWRSGTTWQEAGSLISQACQGRCPPEPDGAELKKTA